LELVENKRKVDNGMDGGGVKWGQGQGGLTHLRLVLWGQHGQLL
jgi:hypothetical protein